jgi:hypothetical protein
MGAESADHPGPGAGAMLGAFGRAQQCWHRIGPNVSSNKQKKVSGPHGNRGVRFQPLDQIPPLGDGVHAHAGYAGRTRPECGWCMSSPKTRPPRVRLMRHGIPIWGRCHQSLMVIFITDGFEWEEIP